MSRADPAERRVDLVVGPSGIIIGLTAHAMSGDEEQARASGCDDYISKPIDEDILFAKIANFLNKGVRSCSVPQ